MITYRLANADDISLILDFRIETSRESNSLSNNRVFDDNIFKMTKLYFLEEDQSTALALIDEKLVGCATMCYITYMPTYAHPTGKRAHLMNVYTKKAYRRQGIASKLVTMLMDEAWERGVTEINLDATDAGRPLYKKLGFEDSTECMVFIP